MSIETEIAGLTAATNSLLSAVNNSKGSLDSAVAAAVVTATGAAVSASVASGAYPKAASTTIPNGLTGYTALVGGTGGTDGTFALGITGGGGVGASATFTVVSGVVTAISIKAPGYGYTSAPAFSFSASANLTGASATAVVGAAIPSGNFYWTLNDNSTGLTLYQNNAGTPLLVSPTVSIPTKDVLDSALVIAKGAAMPLAIGGDLPNGAPANNGSWLIAPAANAVVPASSLTGDGPLLASLGIKYAVKIAAGGTLAFRANWLTTVPNGEFVLGSVIIKKASGKSYPVKKVNIEFIAVGNVPQDNTTQQGFTSGSSAQVKTEDFSADCRRYVIGGKLSTLGGPATFTFINIVNNSDDDIYACGFAVARSPLENGDVDWRSFDPLGAGALASNFSKIEPVKISTMPIGGDLQNGSPSAAGSWFVVPAGGVTPATNATITQFGIKNEALVNPADGGAYVRVDIDPADKYGNNDYVIASTLIRKSPSDAWSIISGEPFTISTIQKDGAQPQSIALGAGTATVAFEDITADIRRYYVKGQYTALTGDISWLIVFPRAAAAPVWMSGFAFALSHRPIIDIDWSVFDPYHQGSTSKRLAAVEGAVVPVQASPDLLVQSSYHLIQGRPLRLLRDGLTSYREAIGFEIAAVGTNGTEVGEEWATPMMRLDGKQFSGAGFFRAKAKGSDSIALYQVPTTFYSSVATKTGSPKILMIGDSLTNNGMPTSLKNKLTSMGITPVMQGTLTDATGTLGEGRPNWLATSFTYDYTHTNGWATSNGMIYDVFPLRPNGGSGHTITVATSGGAVTSANSSGGTGYPNGTFDVVFQNQTSNAGRRARGKIVVSGGVPGAITVTDGGTGYTGSVSAKITASFAEYLASENSGSYGARWNYNPFIRVATAAEISASDARIKNGYIFDFQFYLTNMGITMPDMITVCLGMNDLWNGGGTPATTFAAIKQIVTAIRAVSSTVPIAITIPGQATVQIWNSFVALTKLLMAEYRGQEASGNYILPIFQVTDDKFAYDMTASSVTDPQTGMQSVQVVDPTHPSEIGRSQACEMLLGWVLNRM